MQSINGSEGTYISENYGRFNNTFVFKQWYRTKSDHTFNHEGIGDPITTIGLKVMVPIHGKMDQVGNHVEFPGHLPETHPLIAISKKHLLE